MSKFEVMGVTGSAETFRVEVLFFDPVAENGSDKTQRRLPQGLVSCSAPTPLWSDSTMNHIIYLTNLSANYETPRTRLTVVSLNWLSYSENQAN
jgi:hypothetical protein